MANLFHKLGRMVGPKVRQANWLMTALTGTSAEAVRAEYVVGRDLARGFSAQAEIDADPTVSQLFEDVGGRLVACVTDQERRFCFCGVRSPEVNAFAFPGGFVFVHRPLLDFCGWDKDEIAFVLGHEMGHVIERHAIHRLMTSSLVSSGLNRLPIGGVLRGPVLNLAATLVNQGYSQDQELAADNLGLRLTRAAGYDPQAALRLLRRFRTVPTAATNLASYFASHPPVETRLEAVGRWQKGV